MVLRSFLIGIFLILFYPSFGNLDSLKMLLAKSILDKSEDIQLSLHMKVGKEYYQIENFEKAIYHFQKAEKIAKNSNDFNSLTTCLLEKGLNHSRQNKYSQSLESYFQVLDIPSDYLTNSIKAKTFNRIGVVYKSLGDYDHAFQYQLKALKIYERENDEVGLSKIYYAIGTIFYYQNQYEESLNYYLKSKALCEKLGNKKSIYACYEALGSLYSKIGNNEKSSAFTLKSLELARELNYKTGIAYGLGNLATDKINSGNFEEAEKLFKESVQLKMELDDKWGTIGSYHAWAEMYMKWEKPKLAIECLKNAEKLAEEIQSKPRLMETFSLYKSAYSMLDSHKISLEYLEKYVALKDTVFSNELAEEMGQAKNRHEIEKKENEIALLKKENELFETNKQLQKLQKYIFIIIALFLFVFSYVIFKQLKLQKSTNSLLEEKSERIQIQNQELKHTQDLLLESNVLLEQKNELLGVQNDEIESKNKLLQSSNEDLAQFAYVASHDLKEPLRMISSYTTLLKRRYHELYDDSGKEFMHYIIDAVSRMENMLTDLLTYSRVGTQNETKEWVDIGNTMVIVEANLRARLLDENAKLEFDAENLPAVKANKTQMMQLFQNLCSNAIKFRGTRDPIVNIGHTYNDGMYTFFVEDNGIGISETNQKKVFEMFRRLHTKEEYEGSGIGLSTCKKIVAKHNGDIWVESVEGKGSTFFFTIPCSVEATETVKTLGMKTKV